MKQVEKGNFDIQTEIGEMNEIGQLGRSFNLMVSRTKFLMEEMIHNQENKRKSELLLLQSQINPHFLYNTLDSIVWMAEQKQHEEVVLMTSALAKLFRASITKDQELVPIRVEIEHITNYLLIQKMRYEEELDYVIDIDESILSYKTLKILLQPFVENAIYHGIRNMYGIEDGRITIRGREANDQIVFEVEDNGLGMTPEQLGKIRFNGEQDTRNQGIGIRNVNERIKLYFGHEYGIQIRSEIEVGTCVTITIPKLE
jgi:two-component system sensor histidine kinase YesM